MTCTPKKGDRITIFANVIDTDHSKTCNGLPFQIRIDGCHLNIWISGHQVDRIVERPLTVGDWVHVQSGDRAFRHRIIAIDGEEAWVKGEDSPYRSTTKLENLRRWV
jgi:hypothetical protein